MLPKNKTALVRINDWNKEYLKKQGISVQQIVDKYLELNNIEGLVIAEKPDLVKALKMIEKQFGIKK